MGILAERFKLSPQEIAFLAMLPIDESQTLESIGKGMQRSIRTIQHIIDSLKQKGLIKIRYGCFKRMNIEFQEPYDLHLLLRSM